MAESVSLHAGVTTGIGNRFPRSVHSMPKRNRTKEQRANHTPPPQAKTGPVAPAVDSEQARAAKLFAESIRSHEAADRAERERKAAATAREANHAELIAAKESAAALIRQLRADGRPRQKMADAEAAYRAALAALTEFETGERPHWAPAVPEPDAPASEDGAATDADDEADVEAHEPE
ncbi:MAG: hypothetical protein JWN39_886 [Ilumatobacteraceae bacterium]|nr:hypothetical protein [Ilumatobacteraceae bacterium]